MPIVLDPITSSRRMKAYRDVLFQNPLSTLTWRTPVDGGHLFRPVPYRKNLFPGGSFEQLGDELNIEPGPSLVPSLDGSWSSGGRQSLRLRPTTSVAPTVRPATSVVLPARPRRPYSIGLSVYNGAADPKGFQLVVYLGNVGAQSDSISIPPLSSSRLEVIGRLAPYPSAVQNTPLGDAIFTPISFVLAGLDLHVPTEPFNIDEIFVGEGRTTVYVDYDPYPSEGVSVSLQPLHVWVRNESIDSLSNMRVTATVAGPDAPRIWIDVTPDPGLAPWVSAFNRSVTVRSGTIQSGDNADFWIRARCDEHALESINRVRLEVQADAA